MFTNPRRKPYRLRTALIDAFFLFLLYPTGAWWIWMIIVGTREAYQHRTS